MEIYHTSTNVVYQRNKLKRLLVWLKRVWVLNSLNMLKGTMCIKHFPKRLKKSNNSPEHFRVSCVWTVSGQTDLSWPRDPTSVERWNVNTDSGAERAPGASWTVACLYESRALERGNTVRACTWNARTPCVLTEALDEADDTSPAPSSWHFHGAGSQTARNNGTAGRRG